jgi:HSP20 family protein
LPEGIDPEAIRASFDKGVLEVRIPKPEERKPKRVSITPNSAVIEGKEPATAQAA